MSNCECCDPEAAAARDAVLAADPTPSMGLYPAAPGCRCQLCVPPPDGSLDASEARAVRTVEKYGWQVVRVSGGLGPDFAYTLGLPHRAGHPELLMSGHDPASLAPCLNGLAEQVLDGTVFTGGEVVEGLLPGVPVLLEPLRRTALADTVIRSRCFHRTRVGALQVVWPDRSARFGWQPGGSDQARRGQPASWRVPTGRVGMLAPDPVWPLTTPPDAAAVACRHIVEDGAWAAQVERYRFGDGDEWHVTCGDDSHHDAELSWDDEDADPMCERTTTHLAHLVRAAPSLATLTDLPHHGEAYRFGPDQPWHVVTREAWPVRRP